MKPAPSPGAPLGMEIDLARTDVDAVRESFLMVSADLERAGELFYDKLFEIDPNLENLFVNDMRAQASKLMNTLSIVVSQLQTWPDLAPLVEDLALRHVAYGVKAEHYDSVGQALIEMMDDVLGEAFTEDMRTAWTRSYTSIAGHMIQYAYREGEI
ncbi:MAG: globin domain-containing protein [Pseudomonadota bacterium]